MHEQESLSSSLYKSWHADVYQAPAVIAAATEANIAIVLAISSHRDWTIFVC